MLYYNQYDITNRRPPREYTTHAVLKQVEKNVFKRTALSLSVSTKRSTTLIERFKRRMLLYLAELLAKCRLQHLEVWLIT